PARGRDGRLPVPAAPGWSRRSSRSDPPLILPPRRIPTRGNGFMATPVESNTSAKDPRGFSGLDESQLEKSILRRGLATAAEIEACRTQRKQLAANQKDESK